MFVYSYREEISAAADRRKVDAGRATGTENSIINRSPTPGPYVPPPLRGMCFTPPPNVFPNWTEFSPSAPPKPDFGHGSTSLSVESGSGIPMAFSHSQAQSQPPVSYSSPSSRRVGRPLTFSIPSPFSTPMDEDEPEEGEEGQL